MDYYRVKLSVKKFLNQYNFQSLTDRNIPIYPVIPQHINILYKSKTGSKDMYSVINLATKIPKFKEKWYSKLNIRINNYTWKQVFKGCFKTMIDTSLIWFQYRILNNILGVRELLNKIDSNVPSICRLCASDIETIEHIFVDCPESQAIWNFIMNYIAEKIHINLTFTKEIILLGYINSDTNFEPINVLLTVVKKHIFFCASTQRKPSFFAIKNKLRNIYNEHHFLALLKETQLEFEKKWLRWEPIFIGV